jgi:predicted dehydrogenase
MSNDAVTLACVGAGYWGKNLVRIFDGLSGVRLKWVCDASEKVQAGMRQQYGDVEVTGELEQVLNDEEVEGVVLAVPAVGHFGAARQVLEADKHVYVEKPLTLSAAEAEELVALADQQGKVLMVGHLMVYHPAVQMLKGMVERGELGEIYYLYAQRVNLGIVRKDENALWSLAPHDISILLHLLDQEPDSVSARGECYLQEGIEDVVFASLHFADGKMAQVQVSWLDPHKVRKLTVVGSRKMAVFDDVESAEKVRVYDKAAEKAEYESYGDAITLRFGDVVIPHVDMVEPLKVECQHFVECMKEGKTPRSDGRDGLRVVRVLEAAQRSLMLDGAPVALG